MSHSAAGSGTSLGAASFALGLDSTELEQGLQRMQSQTQTLTQQIQQQLGQQESAVTGAHRSMKEAIESTGLSLEGFHHAIMDITQIALGFTVANTFGGVFRQIGEAMATASEASRHLGEEIEKLEAITGASAEQASTQISIWARFGISAGEAERSFTTLSRAISNFNTGQGGGGAGAKALDELGISLKDAEGKALPLTSVMQELFDKLRAVEDPAKRNADATLLLGRSWQDVARLINEGKSGLEELAKQAKATGLMTDEQVEMNKKWSLSVSGMQAAFQGLTLSLGDVLAEPMTRLADDIKDMVVGWQQNKEGTEAWKQGLDLLVTAIEGVGGAIKDLIALPLGAFLKDVTELTSQGAAPESLAVRSARVTGHAAPTPPAAPTGPVDRQSYSPGGRLDWNTGGNPDPNELQDRIAAAQSGAIGRPRPAGGFAPPEGFGASPGLPLRTFGTPTAGEFGFTYVPPPGAALGVQPRVPLPPEPVIGPASGQVEVYEKYKADLKAATGAQDEKDRLLDLYDKKATESDQKQIQSHTETSQEAIRIAEKVSRAQQALMDADLVALKYKETQETALNESTHKARIAGIDAEKTASDAYYKGAIQAAQAERDLASRHAGDVHDAALAGITGDQSTARADFARQKQDLDEDKLHALQASTEKHDKALADVNDEIQKTRDARQVAALKLQEDELAENQRHAETHRANLDNIHTEGQARLDALAVSKKADQDTATAALRVIQDQTVEYNAQHQDRVRAIQDEGQAASAQHAVNLARIGDEQKALSDAHAATLKAIQDQGHALDEQHRKALQAIQDQAAAEKDARDAQLAALDAATKAQTDALDDQVDAIRAAAAAIAAAKQDAAQSGSLSTAQANLQHDATAGAGGDPAKIIADAQAVDAAQAAIEATAAQRKLAADTAALQAQKKAILDQAEAQRQAIQDQAKREQDLRAAEIRAMNDQLRDAKATLAQETDAQNTAFTARIRQLQDETTAENQRFAGIQRHLQDASEAESKAAQDFAASQSRRTQAVQDTLKKAVDALDVQSAAETKTIAAAVKGEGDRYIAEQNSITTTRKLAADKLTLQQTHDDEVSAAAIVSANTAYKNEQDQIHLTYDDPKEGLYAKLDKAKTDSEADFAARKGEADKAYKAEQLRIKEVYDGPREDGGLALLPALDKAKTDTESAFTARKQAAKTAYDEEKERIRTVYQSTDPEHLGLIPAIEKAKTDNAKALAEQVLNWQGWARDTNTTIQSVIDKLHELHEAQANAAKKPAEATVSPGGLGGGAGGGGPAGGGVGGRGRYGQDSLTKPQWGGGLEALYGSDTRDTACGPLALEGLLQVYGRTESDLGKILGEASARGWWNNRQDSSGGMQGGGSFLAMAEAFGMPMTSVGMASAIADLEQGIPVVINTPHHYFLAQGYDPATKLFDMGETGQSVFNKRFMTIEEASAFGGGGGTLAGITNFFQPMIASPPSGRLGSGDGLLWDGVSLSGRTPMAAGVLPTGASDIVPAQVGGRSEFVRTFEPYAEYGAAALGIDPSIVTAMAISESGGGNLPGYSFFGMKGSPLATGSTSQATWELVDGVRVDQSAGFATFPDAKTSVDAWVQYIEKNDPQAVGAASPEEFAAGLKAGGYMTDTAAHYAATLRALGAGTGFIGPTLPGHARGGVIDRFSLLVDAASGKPYATAAEAGSELIVPQAAGADTQRLQEQAAGFGWDLSLLSTGDALRAQVVDLKRSLIEAKQAASAGVPAYAGLPEFAEGGVINRPTLLVDSASMKPYGIAGERAWESIVPSTSVGAKSGAQPTFHFNVTGPAMSQVSLQIRREFERSQWLHQGWR